VHAFQKKTRTSHGSQKHENYSALLHSYFALLSYAGKSSNRFFVGQVIVVDVKCYKMIFLRKNYDNDKIFAFPPKEDKYWVEEK
jgi:hypothetical protein